MRRPSDLPPSTRSWPTRAWPTRAWPLRAVGTSLAVVALVTSCSTGRAADAPLSDDAAALANGHGSVAEVLLALKAQDLPCLQEVRLPPTAEAEELFTCRIGEQDVVVAHFLDVRQAEAFRAAVKDRDQHGAFTSTWAVRTPDRDLADRIAATLRADARL